MIALLRGINVGGHTVKMERLRELFAELGLRNVTSYIQTGNVFFDTDETDTAKLKERIEQHLKTALGYDVPTFLRTVAEFEAILAINPFKGRDITPDMRCCIMFTSERMPTNVELPLVSPKGDLELIYMTGFEAFVIWYIIDGRPPSNTTFLDAYLGKQTTTRFFHTAEKILAAAKA
jgi:uncharacterized protein (DUF1697 family)